MEEYTELFPECIDGAMGGFAEQGFELGEAFVDGVQSGRRGRQRAQCCACGFNGLTDTSDLMRREIIRDDHVAWRECRREPLAHLNKERLAIHRTLAPHRRRHFPHTPARAAGGRLPGPVRYGSDAALADGGTAPGTRPDVVCESLIKRSNCSRRGTMDLLSAPPAPPARLCAHARWHTAFFF